MTEQHTSKDRKLHLYLVFDDWNSGYSIRKVSLSRRSAKRRSESSDDSSGEDGSEQLAALSRKGAKPLPVFMRVSAERGFPEFFTSAFGTKIMVINPRRPVDDIVMRMPIIDVADRCCTFERMENIFGAPIYIPVSDDRLFSLGISTFSVLQKPERCGGLWVWKQITPPPFQFWDVSSYGVQPDGCILVSTKRGDTFIFDTKENVWKLYSHWVFPFTGRGHYDPYLKGFVGVSKARETFGYLYCCIMASTVTGGTGEVLHPTKPELKCTKHTVYNENQHVSATLVHMRPGEFCLVECVSIDDKGTTDQEELRVNQEPMVGTRFGQMIRGGGTPGGPQGGRFMYCLKTFSLINIKGDLKLTHCKDCCYRLPHEARIGTILQDPVAFWL